MNDGTQDLDRFFFNFQPDSRAEIIGTADTSVDDERVIDIAHRLHRAEVRRSLRVIQGGKNE